MAAKFNVSFTRNCLAPGVHVQINQKSYHKIHSNQWKYICSSSRFCERGRRKYNPILVSSSHPGNASIFKAVWLPEVLKHIQIKFEVKEKCNTSLIVSSSMICYNMSVEVSNKRYFIFLHLKSVSSAVSSWIMSNPTWLVPYQCIPSSQSSLLSWKNASSICEKTSGILPYFPSRNVFDEFLSLLKHNNRLLPVESMFIGLQTSSQVSSLLLHCAVLFK